MSKSQFRVLLVIAAIFVLSVLVIGGLKIFGAVQKSGATSTDPLTDAGVSTFCDHGNRVYVGDNGQTLFVLKGDCP